MNALRNKHLRQLGIPVWTLRDRESSSAEQADNTPQTISMRWRGVTVGLCVAEASADQDLLTAMLNATRCEWQHVEATLESLPTVSCRVVFGLSVAQAMLPGLALSTSDLNDPLSLEGGELIITHGVNDILANPSLKKAAWQSLQVAMRCWQAQ